MTQKTEIEKKLKRVQWIRTVINHHLDDVEKILNDADIHLWKLVSWDINRAWHGSKQWTIKLLR